MIIVIIVKETKQTFCQSETNQCPLRRERRDNIPPSVNHLTHFFFFLKGFPHV